MEHLQFPHLFWNLLNSELFSYVDSLTMDKICDVAESLSAN